MYDPLKLSLYVGLVALLLGLVCISAVAWANANSRNLALATSTLLAAVILVATQLAFELQSRSNSDFFSAELFVDRKTPQIRHWDYENFSGWRMAREIEASNFLAAKDRARFDGDREQLTRDMVMFSLVSYLAAEQYDWQIKRTVYQGTMSTQVSTERLSKLDECTITTKDRLKEQLLAARNSFADADIHIIGANLCLPPESVLTIDDTSLKISTPYCTVAFQLQSSGGVSYMEPKSGGNIPSLTNGEAQFETRITGVRANIEYSWIRAQSRDMKKYEEWSERLIKGARLWFEGEPKARS